MNREQFIASFREHLPAVSKFLALRVARNKVEDLASEIFEIAWRKRDDFNEGSELAWLFRIGGFVIANHRRKEARRGIWLPILDFDATAPSAESLGLANVSVAEAWSKLNAADRNILALSAFDGLSVNQLAGALQISPNTASARLGRARKKFAQYLNEGLSD